MTGIPTRQRLLLWIEYGFVAAIILGYASTAFYFYLYRYLPQPWFYEPSGTFMDWYSLSYASHMGGAYEVNGSIYPPLSFVIMKIFGVASCYPNAVGEPSRDCDYGGIYLLTACLLLNIVLVFKTFRKVDRRTYLPRTFAIGLGFPMMYAYERGNLILFCFTCLLLAYGPLLRSARLRWFFAGMLFNFKVYLIGAVVAPLLKRRWLQVEVTLLFTAAIWTASWGILGEGSPAELAKNVMVYTSGFGANQLLDIWYPGSFVPLIGLLKGEVFPITNLMDSDTAEHLLLAVMVFLRSTQLVIVLAALCAWLRPEVVPLRRVIFLSIALPLTVSEAGGYTEILLLFLLFMERSRGFAMSTAIVLGYILCIPSDYVVNAIPPIERWSWLGGTDVMAQYGIGAGFFLRPIAIYIITWLLCSLIISDVWKDVRSRGLDARRRHRRDAKILGLV